MSVRSVLLVHESRVTQNLLRRVIQAEFNDLKVTTAQTIEEAIAYIGATKFDFVLSSEKCGASAATKLLTAAVALPDPIPVIIMTVDDSIRNRERLRESGAEYFLKTPFNATDLRKIIFEVSDPSSYRGSMRLNIPGIKVEVSWGENTKEIEIINLSRSAVYGTFEFDNSNLDLLKKVFLNIQFPTSISSTTFRNVGCRLVRLQVNSWNDMEQPKEVRVVWNIREVSVSQKEEFNQAFEGAESLQTRAIEMI